MHLLIPRLCRDIGQHGFSDRVPKRTEAEDPVAIEPADQIDAETAEPAFAVVDEEKLGSHKPTVPAGLLTLRSAL